MKIPFDSLNLAAVLAELQPFAGSKVQKISQPEPYTLVLELFGGRGRAHVLLSCDPVFARMHLVTRKPGNPTPLPALCAVMRTHVEGASLVAFRQKGFDRIVEIAFEALDGRYVLVAELMGKHSNLIFVGPDGKVLASAKTVGSTKSVRTVLPGRAYEPPPFPPRKSLLEAAPGEDLALLVGASPFLLKLLAAQAAAGGTDAHSVLRDLARTVREGAFSPELVPGAGAYPVSPAALGLDGIERSSIGVALEQHYAQAIPQFQADQLKNSLATQMRRVLLARETALSDLRQAAAAGKNAGRLQVKAELILAYGPSLPEGAQVLEAWDYEGNPVKIDLDPECGYLENARRLFDKAKRAKSAAGPVAAQIERISKDRAALEDLLHRLEGAERLLDVQAIHDEAKSRRWLHEQPVAKAGEPEKRWEGHKIRELHGPMGFRVLYGENATSNDFLTTRVAKPNDLWLHVRGGVSAHVVVPTGNHPERVGREVLEFAARVAVQNSASKHSGYVSVDYTLKKHVRKPRGSAAGFAVYTNEKTVNVIAER